MALKPCIQATVKRESIFPKTSRTRRRRAHGRETAPSRLCISLSHLRISSSHRCISLSQQRDSCSCAREQLIHEKVVPLSEKSYHFWKSRTTFPPLQLSHHWDSLSRHWDKLIQKREQLKKSAVPPSTPQILMFTPRCQSLRSGSFAVHGSSISTCCPLLRATTEGDV